MKTVFRNKTITGMLSVLPATTVRFEDEIDQYTFPPKQTLRLQKVMGFKQHAIVKETTAASDLAAAGLEHLFEKGLLKKEDIGGLVVACSYPDHFIPPVSTILQGRFGLSEDVFCLDMSQGCVGFLMALIEAFFLLEHIKDRKVVAISTDVLSKRVSNKDRNSYPLVGDAAGIAIVENCDDAGEIPTIICNNGAMGKALMIPAGGSRTPSTTETAQILDQDGDGNLRSLDNMVMQGTDVFTFVQTKVPPMIDELMAYAGITKEDIYRYIFHQPNKFMLRKLAESLHIPYEKMPMNVVEEFGNSSGACIPVCATYNLEEDLLGDKQKYCLSAFGSGLTWAAMIMDLGRMNFCEMLVSDC